MFVFSLIDYIFKDVLTFKDRFYFYRNRKHTPLNTFDKNFSCFLLPLKKQGAQRTLAIGS